MFEKIYFFNCQADPRKRSHPAASALGDANRDEPEGGSSIVGHVICLGASRGLWLSGHGPARCLLDFSRAEFLINESAYRELWMPNDISGWLSSEREFIKQISRFCWFKIIIENGSVIIIVFFWRRVFFFNFFFFYYLV